MDWLPAAAVEMFSHIPEEVFCPQVSGNVSDALRVLKVRLEGSEKKAHYFDFELSLVDPENPVTQVSKTPSDEEFPWCDDADKDLMPNEEEQEEILNTSPEVTKEMENRDDAKLKLNEDSPRGNGEDKSEKNSQKEGTDQSVEKEGTNQPVEKEGTDQTEERAKDVLQDKEDQAVDEEQEKLETIAAEAPNREKDEKEEKIIADFKNLAFPKRPRSMIKSELLVKDVKKFIEDMKKKTAPEDLDVRIIPSNMACRFELPIDLTRLKDECPLSYLKRYCRVTDSRRAVYREKFENYKMELKTITVSELQKIYESLFHETSLHDEVMHLQRLLAMDLSMELDVELFIVVSSLMERIMLKSQCTGPSLRFKKNVFEGTNFSALNGKLHDIDISEKMMNLLKYIRST